MDVNPPGWKVSVSFLVFDFALSLSICCLFSLGSLLARRGLPIGLPSPWSRFTLARPGLVSSQFVLALFSFGSLVPVSGLSSQLLSFSTIKRVLPSSVDELVRWEERS